MTFYVKDIQTLDLVHALINIGIRLKVQTEVACREQTDRWQLASSPLRDICSCPHPSNQRSLSLSQTNQLHTEGTLVFGCLLNPKHKVVPYQYWDGTLISLE